MHAYVAPGQGLPFWAKRAQENIDALRQTLVALDGIVDADTADRCPNRSTAIDQLTAAESRARDLCQPRRDAAGRRRHLHRGPRPARGRDQPGRSVARRAQAPSRTARRPSLRSEQIDVGRRRARPLDRDRACSSRRRRPRSRSSIPRSGERAEINAREADPAHAGAPPVTRSHPLLLGPLCPRSRASACPRSGTRKFARTCRRCPIPARSTARSSASARC